MSDRNSVASGSKKESNSIISTAGDASAELRSLFRLHARRFVPKAYFFSQNKLNAANWSQQVFQMDSSFSRKGQEYQRHNEHDFA